MPSLNSKLFWLIGLLLPVLACRQSPDVPSEPTWIVINSPEPNFIDAVYGDIDGTLLIAVSGKIFQTKDRGKTWLQATFQEPKGISGFIAIKDTLLGLNTRWGTGTTRENINWYAKNPTCFSLDQGAIWQPYQGKSILWCR